MFLRSPADEILYGGAAGGGKSESLLAEALRYVHEPGYHALLLRRTFPELEGKGSGLIARSHELYASECGRYDREQHVWHFTSGATIAFGHLEYPHSVHIYQSAQFAFIGFDELTSFLESQYLYMLSRLRTLAPVRVRIRAATNPGGLGHAWVRRRFIERLPPGHIRFFRRAGDDDVECGRDEPGALSRQFIPARVADNPSLLERDPGYVSRLLALPRVERAWLLDGDWFAANTGLVYGEFDDGNITDDEPAHDIPVELAFDDGYVDPRAILFIQRSGVRVLVFDELYHTRHLGSVCIQEAAEVVARHKLCKARLAVGSHEAIEFRECLRRTGIRTVGAVVPIVDGISAVRALVCDGNGVRTLQVHRRCKHLLEEMREGYRYAEATARRDLEEPLDRDNHACDALRMWVWQRMRAKPMTTGRVDFYGNAISVRDG